MDRCWMVEEEEEEEGDLGDISSAVVVSGL